MNPLESRIDELLTKYFGERWKMFTGCLMLAAGLGLEHFGLLPAEFTELLILAGGTLTGIGAYHKVTRTMKMSEKALAQSHGESKA